MAIEFGSRKETFDNFKVYETMLAGRPFKVEMGKMCGLSNASALIRYGETCVMCNVVMSPKPREGVDFFPLNVEYEEKLYAAGRIPGSFMRREGRPGERAILTSRVAGILPSTPWQQTFEGRCMTPSTDRRTCKREFCAAWAIRSGGFQRTPCESCAACGLRRCWAFPSNRKPARHC